MTRTLKTLAPAAVVVLVTAVLAALVVIAPGFPVRKLNLNDSGIWVTNNAEALFGRLNKSADTLDGLLGPAGGAQGASSFNLEVAQDASTVVARDLRSGRVTPLDVAGVTHRTDAGATIDPSFVLEVRGGTAAVLDPTSGRLWAVRYTEADPQVAVSMLEASHKPIADVGKAPAGTLEGQAAGLSVGLDGTVHAVSTNGREVTIRASGTGFAEPVVATGTPRAGVQVAAIGERRAVLDAQAGVLTLPDGATREVGTDPTARLQEAGPDGDVHVAQAQALLGVGREVTRLGDGNGSTPARPVVLDGCAFSAWTGDPGRILRSCDGVPASPEPGSEGTPLVTPVFRINHGQVLLNDTTDGKIYSFEQQRYVQNWKEATEQETSDQGDPNKETRARDDQPPNAAPDTIGARPGRTTVAHVLDNDAESIGRILSIVGVTQPGGGANATVSPDGQTVLVTLPEQATSTSFEYTIGNGVATATARVDVQVRAENVNEPPALRPGAERHTFAVASWGTLVMPALGDWRDPDGDPVVLESVRADGEKIGLTADGRITFTAGRSDETKVVPVAYAVSDGRSDAVTGGLDLKVLAHNATAGDAPITEPDAVRGQVGQPIVVRPLGNDVPGADPLNPRAVLELASRVEPVDGLEIETDLKSGEVLITAREARTYFLEYTAKFGAAKFAQGHIRVDAAPVGPSQPTASPDHVTVRGTSPVMVDVLANDSDPSGALLHVQGARPAGAGADDQVQVAVLKGRWVRILPRTDAMRPNPQVVHYTISNGLSEPVQGTISVTQLDAPTVDEAVVHDDSAVVRAGDSTLIGVLANDTSLSGAPLVIDRNVADLPAGQLRVLDPNLPAGQDPGDVGTAYVVDDQVRYVAPAEVAGPRQLRVEYQAATIDGTPQTGILAVTVNPQPTDEAPNRAPSPQNLEARATSGQTIEIPIRPWEQDPDGDTVTVVGLGSAPSKGRVMAFTPNTMTYQAYPNLDNGGTDTFRYVVTDAYGATESGVVRIAITAPGEVQPPVAVPDTIIAEPDVDVQVFPLTNDMVTDSDRAVIVPFEQSGNQMPEGIELSGERGPITGRTPGRDEAPVQFAYSLEASGGIGPAAQISIRSQQGYLNPPRLYDEVAEASGTSAAADVLERAWDPDGAKNELRITRVSNPEAVVTGGRIEVPLTDRAQVVSYEVTDRTGATSAAVLFVPAAGAGLPFLRPGALIEMSPNSTHSIDINDYIESPKRTPVRITVAESLGSSPGQLAVEAESEQRLALTSSGDYSGPGSVTLEVTDATDEEVGNQKVLLSIPVQIGAPTPVLRCPPSTQRLVQGGAPVNLRVASVCSVWTPNPADAQRLDYTAEFAEPVGDVRASAKDGIITLEAGTNAQPGTGGTVLIGVAGAQVVKQEMRVEVVAAAKPRLVVRDIADVRQGSSVTQAIQLSSPLRQPQPTVVSITQTGGMPAQASAQGPQFTITPGNDSFGRMTFRVVASDVSDPGRRDRHVEGTLSVTVYGVPDAPTPPQPAMQLRSKSASVTWSPRADNGAPITNYEVSGGGQTVQCGRATRCDVTGLTNGVPASFKVRAQNKAGWSEWSAEGPSVTPDAIPGRVPSFSASSPADGSLTLSWSPAQNEGSAVNAYLITYGGNSVTVPGEATSTTVRGLNNNANYTFSIVARNDAGVSQQPASTSGQSSGRPRMGGINVAASDLGATAQVTVSWPSADAQGPRPLTYTLTRSGGSAEAKSWSGLTGTSVADRVPYDGSTYTYSVTATNATGGEGHTSASVSRTFKAVGKPAAWGGWSARATGTNGQLALTYSVPPSRGGSSTVTLIGAGGNRTLAQGSGTSATSFNGVEIGGLSNGTSYGMQLRVCNENNACSTSARVSATPYGPLDDPGLSLSKSGDKVTWQASGAGNGRTASLRVSEPGGQPSTQGPGSLSLGPTTRTVGYEKSITVTATLSDPAGGRQTRTVSRTVTTDKAPPPPAPPPRTVEVWKGGRTSGDDGTCTYYGGGQCYYIGITTTNFSGSYQCTVSYPGYTWQYPENYTGNVKDRTDKYLGHDTTVTVNCDGVKGTAKW